jgi:hypothetical protein
MKRRISKSRLATGMEYIEKRHRPQLDALRAEILRLWNAPQFNADAFAQVCNEFDLILGGPTLDGHDREGQGQPGPPHIHRVLGSAMLPPRACLKPQSTRRSSARGSV